MKIEHIALYVNDLEKAKCFFETYFQAVSNEMYHNKRSSFKSYFLSFGDGTRLEIMTRPDVCNNEKLLLRTGFSHIAFSVGSKEGVDCLTKRLEADGYKVISGSRTTGDGYYESCILDFEANQIEITI